MERNLIVLVNIVRKMFFICNTKLRY